MLTNQVKIARLILKFEEKMLAFAKDITKNISSHPEEDKNSELKEYLDYHRALNHERLIYHSLDHAKTNLQNSITEAAGDQEKLQNYLKHNFPSIWGNP